MNWSSAYQTYGISILHLIDHVLIWVLTCQLTGSTVCNATKHFTHYRCCHPMCSFSFQKGDQKELVYHQSCTIMMNVDYRSKATVVQLALDLDDRFHEIRVIIDQENFFETARLWSLNCCGPIGIWNQLIAFLRTRIQYRSFFKAPRTLAASLHRRVAIQRLPDTSDQVPIFIRREIFTASRAQTRLSRVEPFPHAGDAAPRAPPQKGSKKKNKSMFISFVK